MKRIAATIAALLTASLLTAAAAATPPSTKEVALRIVSTAENSTTDWASQYGYIEDIGDGRGYTAGIVGFCSGTGDMLKLVQRYHATTPGNPLDRYLPALVKIDQAPYSQRPALSHSLLGAPFIAAWKTAAKTGAFKAAQRYERDRVYWNPAAALAKRDGLHRLGLFIYYDISVNHGPGDDGESFGGIVAGVQKRGILPPSRGGDELTYLAAVAAARDKVLRSWGDYQADGRSGAIAGFIKAKNVNLTLPLTWSMYGDTFTIK
jgi:chitosanase